MRAFRAGPGGVSWLNMPRTAPLILIMPAYSSPPAAGQAQRRPHVARYILIGFFTLAPLWVTWLVLDFLFNLLARIGAPFLRGLAHGLRPVSEILADWLLHPGVQYVLAALFTLAGLYAVGVLTSLVLGRRLIAYTEGLLARLPLVQTIYGATKKFLETLRKPPVSGQRVVLIAFPSPDMKALGFVTKVMTDPDSGRQLAAVYVPTSPNPTSGYIEIVPMDDVVQTDWSVEEAMAFVMTGGTNAPDTLRFGQPGAAPQQTP
ncbi:MAG: hypothetical protein FD187_1263 [bacterium]|nr:MAG: hypothetical protein FD142_535 [bacterium]KAF0149336.1 MAG: hypothetical protein FD187_1263 [bacterium]KAF0169858.1 MAG: hypothetical protein FD158_245 [bacterium]TXT18557.1 MAG: hypothetical protein FD132_2045 [bacterium]